tara:strand:+ start:986 stop:1789 length:804 start_codon:yes stop_codon:yes gene_type:complete
MREALKYCGRSIGFVPTMGYLHEGHLSLVRAAREQNDSLVTSIFVNPTQFGPHEDYRTYPRDIESDLNKLEKMGVDLVFTPSVEEMYPDGLDTQITVGSIGDRLEGLSRPGHFNGVATIVCKFISILSPDNIYFGQKDYQQTRVVSKIVEDLNLNARVVVLPTIRQDDGLALSSRNSVMTSEEREASRLMSRILRDVKLLKAAGTYQVSKIKDHVISLVDQEPIARLDYASIVDSIYLYELDEIKDDSIILIAVWIGNVRLIDNDFL